MKKLFWALAALLLVVAPSYAQDSERVPLAIAWDMDGEAADDDQVVVSANLADGTNYTVAASPDTCRVVDMTITDANSSTTAGTVTVTGTDCWGDALVCTFDFSVVATRGSGVKTIPVTSGSASTCTMATVTSVATNTLTGEEGAGVDLIKVGYTANSTYTYPIYGIRKVAGGKRYVDPFDYGLGAGTITINGTSLASFASVAGGAFQNLAVGDLIYIQTDGQTFERRLTAVTNDDAATMDVAIPTASAPATTAEVRFRYKKFFKLVEANEAWIPIRNRDAGFFIYDVDANANTGGSISSIECAVFSAFAAGDFEPNVQVDTDTVASAATGTATTSIDLSLAPYTHCRAGVKFGTGDDADAANEDINLFLFIRRRN